MFAAIDFKRKIPVTKNLYILRAFTSGYLKKKKKSIFYILKRYFIYFTDSFNTIPNIQYLIFMYNIIKWERERERWE